MSDRASFTDQQWQTLQFAPLWTLTAVAGADGDVDVKELTAFVKELQEANAYKEPLVREILISLQADFQGVMEDFKADDRSILDGLQEAGRVLDENVGAQQARNFKLAMLLIGKNVAEASGGGLFGMGERVSNQEKKAIVLVAAALGVSP